MQFKTINDLQKSAERFRKCPKIHFWGNKGTETYIILKVPEGDRFWSDYVAENPEKSFGGVSAKLIYLDQVVTPEDLQISYKKIQGDTTPCGSRCNSCPSYGPCLGCPSLI